MISATVKVSYADPKNVVYIANIPRDMSYDLIVKIVNEMTNVCTFMSRYNSYIISLISAVKVYMWLTPIL